MTNKFMSLQERSENLFLMVWTDYGLENYDLLKLSICFINEKIIQLITTLAWFYTNFNIQHK